MERWKNDLGYSLRLIGLTGATWVSGHLFVIACTEDTKWVWMPGICGFVVMLVAVIALLIAIVRPLLDPGDVGPEPRPFVPQSFPAPPPPPPPPPPPAEEGASSGKRGSARSRSKSSRKRS
ncbi:MAG: hypothetical protein ACYTGB_19255 [Planctomycetota bacterium]|jgi:hypothetical protein